MGLISRMGSVPMNRTRAGLICEAPQDHSAARVREAATYLLGMSGVTEGERRMASEAMAWLRSKRDAPKQPDQPKPAPSKPKRKGKA